MIKTAMILTALSLSTIQPNGGTIAADHLKSNGISLNGISLNGISLNGVNLNGLNMNGLNMNGVQPKGFEHNAGAPFALGSSSLQTVSL